MSKPRPAFKIWLETDKGYVFGPGVYRLLKHIEKTGTLKEASKSLEMSYRYAWGLIREAEERLGESLIDASKGGRCGGGSTKITKLGKKFIEDFETLRNDLYQALTEKLLISENQIAGKITNIEKKPEGLLISMKIDNVNALFKSEGLEVYEGDEIKIRIILEQ